MLTANVASSGTGTGGSLIIDTGRLQVRDGAQVTTGTLGAGKGGKLQITASDSVEVVGIAADGQKPSSLLSASAATGEAGNLRIDTRQLLVRDGAQVGSGTFDAGKGGNLQIAADSIKLIGTTTDGQFPSGLFSESDGSGDAGDLRIDTRQLLVRDGAQVSASTLGVGKGGNIQLTADSVELIGTLANGQVSSGLFSISERTASGNAGDLRISTDRLLVRDGAIVLADTRSPGRGGSLQVTANSVELIGTSANGQINRHYAQHACFLWRKLPSRASWNQS